MVRIVVTGMGVISPLGLSVETFQKNLFAGKNGISTMTFRHRDMDIAYQAGAVLDFKVDDFIDSKKSPLQDRCAQLGVAAAKMALHDSGLNLDDDTSLRIAGIIGTGVGGQNTQEESYNRLLLGPTPKVHPLTIPKLMVNAGASHISMECGLRGPCFTVASACASSLHAIGVAVSMLRSGMADQVMTGGTESCLTFGTLKGWEALRVMSSDTCRPFSDKRSGMIIGEGAAMFILETLESAQKRGAKIYAEILGFGMSSDAKDLTTPDVCGMGRAIENALMDAKLRPEQIDYINAHGTGTRINDLTETAAVKNILGDHAKKIALSSSKSMFGHALGAAGALEMLATILAVRNDTAPPTMNYLGADPECDLDYVPNSARKMPIHIALKSNFAFGGLNAVVAVGKAP